MVEGTGSCVLSRGAALGHGSHRRRPRDGEQRDRIAGEGTFATLESALNWLLESPGTRDLRVTALSKEQPVRHVVGHFTLDANFDRFDKESKQPDDRIVHEPEIPE